jgi:prepilin signal peptidase PulO-like enzyme (type II secretory pathway)
MLPDALRLVIVSVVGVCLGAFVNWAIYSLAWRPRPISPWSRLAPGASLRGRLDLMPIIGWFALSRESAIHGRGFWVRPLLLEVGTGVALAALYWWEVMRLGLIEPQVRAAIMPPTWTLHWQFASHALLLLWILAASFIDIDEKIIPDEITVTGTLLGLVLATLMPMSMLPHVAERPAPIAVSAPLENPAGAPILGPIFGQPLWLEPVTAVAPKPWPPSWGAPRQLSSLAIAVGCYWLWCFALAPRIWRGRRGPVFALRIITTRLCREFRRPPLRWMLVAGTAAIVFVWAFFEESWAGLFTALIGLAASGGIVWAVRLIGTAALRREAMGFGDVTLMMMIGAFLGWQACLITFFLAPIPGLFAGILQFALRRDDVIPYGPFLCMGAAIVAVAWAPIWLWAQPLFAAGALVPVVLIVCLSLLGVMLAIWQIIKTAIFGELDLTTEDTEDTE